jgi:hypothetical protein
MCKSFNDVLEPYAGTFVHLIQKIDTQIARAEKELEEIDQYVEETLDRLVDKYQEQLKTFGDPDAVRQRVKNSHRKRLTQERKDTLNKAIYKLGKLKSDALSVAPASVFQRLYP